ncbi:hypothetical protein MRBLPD1_005384 [Pseudomonas brassicacearum]|uniref:hypothetical protein n=1 Tax=Pseudomonas brassicacearum TaxID=930166 RepID=UPI003467B5C4
MTKSFDMALFLSGVLTGSNATQQRHLRQARAMQAAIQQRWQRDNPWTWQLKHVRWFFTQRLKGHSNASRDYYRLTALLVWKRLGNGRELPIGRSTSRA